MYVLDDRGRAHTDFKEKGAVNREKPSGHRRRGLWVNGCAALKVVLVLQTHSMVHQTRVESNESDAARLVVEPVFILVHAPSESVA